MPDEGLRVIVAAHHDQDLTTTRAMLVERLLDPWVQTNGIDYVALPVVNLESQHWLRKGTNFLRRKFVGKGEG